jgi:pyruvate kinase
MVKIVAQIDTPSAIRNYHDILRVSDAIMVSRTNLGMVIKPEKVGGLDTIYSKKAET